MWHCSIISAINIVLGLLRQCFFDLNKFVLELVEPVLHDGVEGLLVLEGDKPETSALAGLLVVNNHDVFDGAELSEVGLELFIGGAMRQTSHKNLVLFVVVVVIMFNC